MCVIQRGSDAVVLQGLLKFSTQDSFFFRRWQDLTRLEIFFVTYS